jgi:hypothetical protein
VNSDDQGQGWLDEQTARVFGRYLLRNWQVDAFGQLFDPSAKRRSFGIQAEGS